MGLTGNPVLGTDLNDDALERFERTGGKRSSLKEIMSECEIVIATTGAPDLIPPGMIRKGQVILALSNPRPEIDPEVALERGAVFAADGQSVNNVLGFPGIFRGAVDSLGVGELSNVLSTSNGFYILKVLSRTESKETNFEEIREPLHHYLEQRELEKLFKGYVRELRQKFFVDIKV